MIKFSHIFFFCLCCALVLTIVEQWRKPKPVPVKKPVVVMEEEETKPENEIPTLAVNKLVNDANDFPSPILLSMEENLYGEFYGGRATYFIVDNPSQLLHQAVIASITFSYLDEELYRSKYVLDRNISNALIEKYGEYQIKAFDEGDKQIIKNELLYEFFNGKRVLNRGLQNYALSWEVDGTLIKLRVNQHDPKEPFVYIEQRMDYKAIFSIIESFQ